MGSFRGAVKLDFADAGSGARQEFSFVLMSARLLAMRS
jgi:hypothetical protein